MLSYEIEERAYLCRNDRKGINRFIMEMDPLVRKTASKYSKFYASFSDDIYTAAQEGLLRAVNNFDFKYHGFVKYASFSMESEIRSFLSKETRLIRIPTNVIEKQRKISSYMMKNPGATLSSIMNAAGIKSEDSMKRIMGAHDAVALERENPSHIPDISSPEMETLESEVKSEIEKAFMSLKRDERYIIGHSYELSGYEKKETNEIASFLRVSPQTVIYRRHRALEKMKVKLTPLMT